MIHCGHIKWGMQIFPKEIYDKSKKENKYMKQKDFSNLVQVDTILIAKLVRVFSKLFYFQQQRITHHTY